MLSKLILIVGLLLSNSNTTGENEMVLCEVESLTAEHIQWNEYKCLNVLDNTDTIVIVDVYDEYRIGDLANLELNKYGEIVDYEIVYMVDNNEIY